jgi:hypothetical protein
MMTQNPRVFVYEVQGLHQTEQTALQSHEIRQSGSVFLKVPYSRMTTEMQRILRLGGKIVKISALK